MNKVKILLAMWLINVLNAQDPTANLPQGRVVGIKVYTQNSVAPIEVYFGIPYATPPVGRYRFSRADGNLLPVLVIFYSESWAGGELTLPCQEIAAEGIVVVTVSYRLHILSFFTLLSIHARGNLALLDQYMALLWISDNIAAFGGNSTAITLLGHSAGADSILHHMASPRSVGLFQRAILMSPNEIWKILSKGPSNANELEKRSRQIAKGFGCSSDGNEEIVECLRKVPLNNILSLYSNNTWTKVMQPINDYFLPNAEQYLPTILSQALEKISLNIDVILGTTDLEAANNDKYYDEILKLGAVYVSEYSIKKVIPDILETLGLNAPESKTMLINAIRWEYWGMKMQKNTDSLEAVETLTRIQSSANWGAGSVLLANRFAGHVGRLYVYRYSQKADTDLNGHQNKFKGAVHGSDLVALLGDPLMLQIARKPSSPDQKQISLVFRKQIANFVKYGSPTSNEQWQKYSKENPFINDIRIDGPIKSSHDVLREASFWLYYLPLLMNSQTSAHTEQLTSDSGSQRLRGGVFALCSVSVFLLLLLLASVFLLLKEKNRRKRCFDESSRL